MTVSHAVITMAAVTIRAAEPAAVVVGAVNEAGADADLLEAPRNDRTDEEERK